MGGGGGSASMVGGRGVPRATCSFVARVRLHALILCTVALMRSGTSHVVAQISSNLHLLLFVLRDRKLSGSKFIHAERRSGKLGGTGLDMIVRILLLKS